MTVTETTTTGYVPQKLLIDPDMPLRARDVVSLGLDAAEAGPGSPLRVSEAGYREAGRRVAALGPTLLVQEGGYDLATLGSLAVAALAGAAEAHP